MVTLDSELSETERDEVDWEDWDGLGVRELMSARGAPSFV